VEIDLEYVYYSFTPESDGTYCFYSTSEDDVDTYGELLNSEFITMMQNDDTNGYQFEIVQELEAGETYYIGIRSFGEELTAQLHVDKI